MPHPQRTKIESLPLYRKFELLYLYLAPSLDAAPNRSSFRHCVDRIYNSILEMESLFVLLRRSNVPSVQIELIDSIAMYLTAVRTAVRTVLQLQTQSVHALSVSTYTGFLEQMYAIDSELGALRKSVVNINTQN